MENLKINGDATSLKITFTLNEDVNPLSFIENELPLSVNKNYTLESGETTHYLSPLNKEDQYLVKFNEKYLEIILGDFEISENLIVLINLFKQKNIILSSHFYFETACEFSDNNARSEAFKHLQPVKNIFNPANDSMFYIKEMFTEEEIKYIIDIFEDTLCVENEEDENDSEFDTFIPVIGIKIYTVFSDDSLSNYPELMKKYNSKVGFILSRIIENTQL